MVTSEVKRKRGRPCIFSDLNYAECQALWPDHNYTKRGLRNLIYEIRAFGVIVGMKRRGLNGLEFLLDPNEKEIFARGILRELGQCDVDKEIIERTAIAICEAESKGHKTIREWAALIRFCRLSGFADLLPAVIKETVSQNDEVEQ